jgi:predicted AAA+ superfamily ATPase
MQTLIERYNILKKEYKNIYQRNIFSELESSHRIVGVVGSRGVGKTTYLLNYLNLKYKNSARALYISADDVYFSNSTLIDLARQFVNEYDGKILCIDEIHRYPNWAQELKNIYDKYSSLKVIFSGSSSVDLIKQKYDLSRRAVLKNLPGFSFREYLEFTTGKKLPILTLRQVISQRISSVEEITGLKRLLGLFNDYQKTGYYPIFKNFSNEEDFYEALNGVIDKVINIDISSYYSLKTDTLPVFKKILYFLFTSKPGSINVNRLSASLRKSFPDTSRYIEMTRESGLARYLLSDKSGHALIRNAEKVYLDNTNLAHALSYRIGKPVDRGSTREILVINQLESAGYRVCYSSRGDIIVGAEKKVFGKKEYIFEIGGAGKNLSQIKDEKNAYVVADDILFGDSRKIPLYLFGFLY